MLLEVAIPVYNEEKRIGPCIEELAIFFEKNNNLDIKITVADNASTDKTEEVVKEYLAKYSWLDDKKATKKGIGIALESVWDISHAKYVGFMDCDLATDLKHLIEVYNYLETDSYDAILGSRIIFDSKVSGRKLYREFLSRFCNGLLRLIMQNSFTDSMCGFKFFKISAYHDIKQQCPIQCKKWFFPAELAIKTEWYNYRLLDLPVEWVDDSENTKFVFWPLFKEYTQEVYRILQEKKLLKQI